MKERETDLVKAALELLRLRGVVAWRNNTGAFAGEHKGKRWYVRAGHPGSPDILGVIPPDGRLLAAEAKVGRNKASGLQEAFLGQVRRAGGLAVVFRSLEELDDAFRTG